MRNFIKGFLSCLVLLESIFTFIIWKWAKGENICGWTIKPIRKYSCYTPKTYSYKTYSNAKDYSLRESNRYAFSEEILEPSLLAFSSRTNAEKFVDELIDKLEMYGTYDEMRMREYLVRELNDPLLSYMEVNTKYEQANIGYDESDLEAIKNAYVGEYKYGYAINLPDTHKLAG